MGGLILPNEIRVRPVFGEDLEILKDEKIYDVSDWIGATLNFEGNQADLGAEAEGFFINTDGFPVMTDGIKFRKIPRDEKTISRLSEFDGAEFLNRQLSQNNQKGFFANGEAKISEELYKPSVETSLSKGHNSENFFNIFLGSLYEMVNFAENNGVLYLPSGNMPISTKNVPNLSDPYYRYLFEERDGHRIGDFRGAGLQLHKGMESYELAIYTFNKMRHLLSMFAALSQNSPFDEGTFRGSLSERTYTKSSWHMTGIPPSIDNNFLNELQKWLDEKINSVTPYFYGLRFPRVDIRTIENCSMDMIHDLKLMIALVDLYYRITEKLKLCFAGKAKLPIEIFGNAEGSFVETEILNSNYYDTIRNGTKSKFVIPGARKVFSLEEFLGNVFKFIEDIPSIVPEETSSKFGIHGTDFTHHVLSKIISSGNLAEQTIRDFGFRANSIIHPKKVPTGELAEYNVLQANHFAGQISQLIH